MRVVFNRNKHTELRLLAEMFFDAQSSRKRIEQRINGLPTMAALLNTGKIPQVVWVKKSGDDEKGGWQHIESRAIEHTLRLRLRNHYKKTAPPALVNWQKSANGVGEDLMSRLLGHLGHPVIAIPKHWEVGPVGGDKRVLVEDEPFYRTIPQLWQYCGHGSPSKRFAGMSQDQLFAMGNPETKMIVHLLSESAIKEPGRKWKDPTTLTTVPAWPFRAVYETRRTETAERAHAQDCARCGPSKSPAKIGSPWSDAHAHADALRIVGKEILRNMWMITANEMEHA